MLKTAVVFVVLPLIFFPGIIAFGQEITRTQYKIDSWNDENGLPHNTVWAIVQTRSGYLWLGTNEGLSRFDGINFYTFDRDNTPQLTSNKITALYQDRDANLWIGTDGGGVVTYKKGVFRHYDNADGFLAKQVLCFSQGPGGNIWIGTNGSGLYKFDERRRFTPYTTKEGLPHNIVTSIISAPSGNLWIGTLGGFCLFKTNRFINYDLPGDNADAQQVNTLYEDTQKILWIGTSAGLYQMRDRRVFPSPLIPGSPGIRVNTIYAGSNKTLWYGTRDHGLFRYKDGIFSNITKKDWLTEDRVYSIMEDRDRNLWVGTLFGGLNRLRPLKDNKFKVLGVPEGLSGDSIWAVYESSDGYLWIGTYNGLNRLKNGQIVTITKDNGLASNIVFAVCEDRSGFIWVGTEKGLNQLESTPSRVSVKNKYFDTYVAAVMADSRGNLWAGTQQALLKKEKSSTRFEEVLAGDINSIYEDKKGNIWISIRGRGLSRYKDGQVTSYSEQDGLIGNIVNSLYADNDSVLWIAAANGLSRFEKGRFTNYTKQDGLFSNQIFQVLEDPGGYFWISCNKGIFRVRKQDLDHYAKGKIAKPLSVTSVAYGRDDGMRSSVCSSGYQTCGVKTRDGTLWFATEKGVVKIEPHKIKINPVPPTLVIERILLDGAPTGPIDSNQEIIIEPGVQQIAVHFTALDFLNPKKLKFKYMLEGFDRQWVEADSRRVAYYTNPGGGAYRFRVIARNEDGVWNEKGASITFDVTPSWKSWGVILPSLLGLGVLLIILIYFSRKYSRLAIFWKNQTYVGTYKLMEKIGVGGMGTVYKAKSLTGDKETVALKLLKDELFEDRNLRERFKQEAHIADQLDHPNIIKVIERGESRGAMFIAMEFLEGITLDQKINEEGQVKTSEGLEIMIQMTSAVVEIHSRNIVHRDLKPGNIMLIKKGKTPDFVKLLDFGLAKLKYQTRLTQTGIAIGTIHYMAPEQFSDAGWSPATDIYSLGVMFREILTGEKLFDGENSIAILKQIMHTPPMEPIKNRSDVPAELNDLILKMAAKDGASRPSVEEVLETLQRIQASRHD
ncbi:MAG: protein kinase [bacterium]|nr:protein kinase [bacterium]